MKKLNITYQSINFSLFAMMGAMIAFASNYLLDLGYSNSEIGIILALYSVVSFFLQPIFVNYSDSHPEIPLQSLINLLLLAIIAGSAIMLFCGTTWGKGILVSLCFILVFACMLSTVPLVNTAAFLYEKFGIQINYGLARGLGSLSYALISMLLGYVFNVLSPKWLPAFYILFAVITFFFVKRYRMKLDPAQQKEETHFEKEEKSESISMLEFAKKYKSLIILLLGYMLIYTTHMIINSFYIQIVNEVHGTSANMGTAVFIAAICELPAMFGFQKLAERFKITNLLKISLVFYLLKHVVTFLATNVWMLYFAAFLQFGAYALFTPAIVYYINQIVSAYDSLTGQTVNTMFTTAAGIIGSLLGGFFLDLFGVHQLLLISVILTLAGLLISMAGIEAKRTISR